MLILLGLISLLVFAVPVRWKYGLTLGVTSAGVLLALGRAVVTLSPISLPSGVIPYSPLAWPVIDKLSAVFLLIISVAMMSVMLYGRDYIKAHTGRKSAAHLSVHYVSLVWMFLAMMRVVTCRDGFDFLICWELMTLASFLLILFEGDKRETRRAAINYLILMHIGFIFLVAGFVISSGGNDLGGFDSLRNYFAGHDPLPLFIVFLIGFGMKAGIFPLHIWLPEAHPAAPSHVSALMSGVMIKMGVYGMFRVVSSLVSDLHLIGVIVLILGLTTALWGIVQAALQNDLKKLLAYSSIENIGIIFTGLGAGILGLSAGSQPLILLGFSGALLHTVNHSLFKPMLFMGAGSVMLSTHTRNLDELGGLSKKMPVTTILFLVGAIAICALPPFNGFISEFLIYLGLLKSTASGTLAIWSAAAAAGLALVGGIAILVFSKAFGIGFLGAARSKKAVHAKEVTSLMLAAQMIPLAGILLIGLFPATVLPVVESIIGETFNPYAVGEFGVPLQDASGFWSLSLIFGVLILLVIGLALWRRRVQRRQPVAESPTWGCGFTAPDARMQYTGESFSEGLEHMANSPTNARSRKNRYGDAVSKEEVFARPHRFGVSHKDRVDRMVSDRWAYLLQKINARLALFQTGKINHYILHALLFLAFVFLITWIGLI